MRARARSRRLISSSSTVVCRGLAYRGARRLRRARTRGCDGCDGISPFGTRSARTPQRPGQERARARAHKHKTCSDSGKYIGSQRQSIKKRTAINNMCTHTHTGTNVCAKCSSVRDWRIFFGVSDAHRQHRQPRTVRRMRFKATPRRRLECIQYIICAGTCTETDTQHTHNDRKVPDIMHSRNIY